MAKISFINKLAIRLFPTIPVENKLTDNNVNEIKESVNALYDGSGWISYTDTTYTSSNKLLCSAGVDTVLPCDSGSTIDAQSPNVPNSDPVVKTVLWDSVNNKITPEFAGDGYLVRINFKAEIANNNGYYVSKLDIGSGTPDIITERTTRFPRGGNIEHSMSETNFVFALGNFVTNGGTIIIEPSHDMLIWDINITICRVHLAK